MVPWLWGLVSWAPLLICTIREAKLLTQLPPVRILAGSPDFLIIQATSEELQECCLVGSGQHYVELKNCPIKNQTSDGSTGNAECPIDHLSSQ